MTLALIAILFSSPASAGDETTPTAEGITQIPEGTTITMPGKKLFTVTKFSYLLPESYYDQALISAKKLLICEPALDRSTALTSAWIGVTEKAISTCTGQFDSDKATVEALRLQVVELGTRAVTAESKLDNARTQRNTAWAITGGLVLGAVAVTAVAIGN